MWDQLSNSYSHIVLRQAPEHEFKLLIFMYNIINNLNGNKGQSCKINMVAVSPDVATSSIMQ